MDLAEIGGLRGLDKILGKRAFLEKTPFLAIKCDRNGYAFSEAVLSEVSPGLSLQRHPNHWCMPRDHLEVRSITPLARLRRRAYNGRRSLGGTIVINPLRATILKIRLAATSAALMFVVVLG